MKILPLLSSREATSKKLLKHIRAAAKICGHANYELTAGFEISGFDPERLRLGALRSVRNVAHALRLAPLEELADIPAVSAAGVRIADMRGEELQKPPAGALAGGVDHGN
ncbi:MULTISPECIES: hypothetical protein [unclassified Mesorhizobium]|uniref:hypothetical protein n=1 Tax=unclassified Mesorhizobium TaxID=325217 RepID=UPI0012EB396D|nr:MULTISPECIES: hypothetical protein [unclassified Mesorhizobium]WJI74981.1 hypothetical protein NLY37_29615 [Mesorhizobium sp. C395A]